MKVTGERVFVAPPNTRNWPHSTARHCVLNPTGRHSFTSRKRVGEDDWEYHCSWCGTRQP